jgi:hypothetical protein
VGGWFFFIVPLNLASFSSSAEEQEDDDGANDETAEAGAHMSMSMSMGAAAAAALGAMSVLLPPLDVTRHGLEDVHFAVKGLLNAKTGGWGSVQWVQCAVGAVGWSLGHVGGGFVSVAGRGSSFLFARGE